ncbi:MAG: UDP-N-acetylglucosamine--N-acetylmuramyl-(pentapeptide) pyrophosphoryl-undecaprenol N-acetylglucosamine transferase [Oscillospiraceae bacterium]|nr:UDP-N-acetylglucosamine--N-acetylmuramyl-(pentapeptide) pyrophosphoryl-undecaprenol N-acetylglucosamine transferase [Oscillospiraceae bacterium]
MRVVLTGGGTAGHINSALAVFDQIKKHKDDDVVVYIGRAGGMEEDLVKRAGVRFRGIQVSGLSRDFSLASLKKNYKAIQKYIKTIHESKNILKVFAPDIVFATGGYVSAPVIREALSLKIKVVMHEQNEKPGLTTKLFGNRVDALLLPSNNCKSKFKKKTHRILRVVGNPVNSEFGAYSKQEAREELGWAQNEFCIVSYGGSLGAERINRAVADLLLNYKELGNIRLIHATGAKNYNRFIEYLKSHSFDFEKHDNVVIQEYIYNMPRVINAADLVISRAGAISIAELQAAGKPAIFIPSPNVTGNHQFFNAQVLVKNGAGIMLDDKTLDGNILMKTINKLLSNEETLIKMAERIKLMHIKDSAELIYSILREVANK